MQKLSEPNSIIAFRIYDRQLAELRRIARERKQNFSKVLREIIESHLTQSN